MDESVHDGGRGRRWRRPLALGAALLTGASVITIATAGSALAAGCVINGSSSNTGDSTSLSWNASDCGKHNHDQGWEIIYSSTKTTSPGDPSSRDLSVPAGYSAQEGNASSQSTSIATSPGLTYHVWIDYYETLASPDFEGVQGGQSFQTAPVAPTGLTGVAGDGKVTLSWNAVTGATSYTVYKATSLNGSYTSAGAFLGRSNNAVTGLADGTKYWFKVSATDNEAGGLQSTAAGPYTPVAAVVAPGAPTISTATAGNASATVTWTAPTTGGTPTSYDIYEWHNIGDYTKVATGLTGTSDTLTGLTNGGLYSFEVSGENSAGEGDKSTPSIFVIPSAIPDAPVVSAQSGENGKVDLSWSVPANNGSAITGYTVYELISGTYTAVASGLTGTTATVTGLSNGISYSFEVSATNGNGEGPMSSAASATPYTVPGVPAGVTVSSDNPVASQSLAVSWAAPASNGGDTVTGYTVTATPSVGAPVTTTVTGTSTTLTGLTNGTPYSVTVTATNHAGPGAASTPVNGTPATTPGVPTGLAATPGDGQVSVSWSAPADGGSAITGYIVQWSANGGATWTSEPTPSTSVTITGLTDGTSYVFQVQAVNRKGSSAFSSSSSAVTPTKAETAPGTPTGVSGTAADRSAAVSWTAPISDGGSPVTGYQLQYSTDGGTTWSNDPANPVSGTSATVSGLTNGSSYIFRVAAINAIGTGSFSVPSAPVIATAGGKPGADKTGLTITVNKSSVVKGARDVFHTHLLDTNTGRGVGGATVVLQVKNAKGKWVKVAAKSTGPKGRAIDTVKITTGHTYRWHFAGNQTLNSSNSKALHVSVHKAHKKK